jgi:dynein heavy chain
MAVRYKDTDRRYVYTTPKSYLELLKLYKLLLAQKRAASTAAISRLANGLEKLRETGALVSKIEEELKVKLAEAEIKKAEAAEIATDEMKHPLSMFARLLIGTLVTGVTAFIVKIEVP